MAAAGQSSPDRSQPLLTAEDPRIRGTPVLHEEHPAIGIGSEDALELSERCSRVPGRAQRPRRVAYALGVGHDVAHAHRALRGAPQRRRGAPNVLGVEGRYFAPLLYSPD